jgi:hypothetical protein
LAEDTEVLGGNLPQCLFVHHKPHMLCPDANPGRRGGKPASNRLSYGTALVSSFLQSLQINVGIILQQNSYFSLFLKNLTLFHFFGSD